MFRLYSLNRKHSDYCKNPSEIGFNPISADIPPTVTKKLLNDLKYKRAFFVSYFEHGQCVWMRVGGNVPAGVEFQWDGVRYAGMLIWEPKGTPLPPMDKRESWADEALVALTDMYNGVEDSEMYEATFAE